MGADAAEVVVVRPPPGALLHAPLRDDDALASAPAPAHLVFFGDVVAFPWSACRLIVVGASSSSPPLAAEVPPPLVLAVSKSSARNNPSSSTTSLVAVRLVPLVAFHPPFGGA